MPTQEKKVLKGRNASTTAPIWFASDTAHIMFIHITSAVKPVHILMAGNRVSKSCLMAGLCFHRFLIESALVDLKKKKIIQQINLNLTNFLTLTFQIKFFNSMHFSFSLYIYNEKSYFIYIYIEIE